MATIKEREKRRLARLRKNRREQLDLQDEKTLLSPDEDGNDSEPFDEEGEEDDGMEVAKTLKKDYYASAYPLTPAPTSYEEMDAAKEAREKAHKVSEESYTVQELVSNIAYSPMTPEDKSKAIVKVGKDFGTRLKAIASDKMEKEVDMDLLELRALIAKDSRQTSIIEKAKDFIASNFSTPKPETKTYIRKWLKDTVAILEKGENITTRGNITELLKSAKDAGIGSTSLLLIEKDASGSWRAVMYPTNNFKDRDGEILTEAAHEEYVDWVNKNMDCAPVLCTWHQPGTYREHQMDFIGYQNGMMIASLPLTENEAARILKTQAQFEVGLSMGGVALERELNNSNIITKYRMFEVSDLPLERASNPFTEIELISKEAQMDSKAMKEYLAGMIGDEARADAILEKMALTQAELRKAGVQEKEVKTETVTTTEVVTKDSAPAVNLDELVEKLSKEFGMEELSATIAALQESAEKVPVLEALIKEMATSTDEKLAEMIQPPIKKSLAWMQSRPTQKTDNILKKDNEEDEKLQKSVPATGWLSEAFGTQPVQTQ